MLSAAALFAAVFGVVFDSRSAWAAPSTAPFAGQTGLGIIPTTQTIPRGNGEISLHYERAKTDGGNVRFLPVVSAGVGFSRGEIGVGYLKEKLETSGVSFNSRYQTIFGKYRVYQRANGVQAAIGAHYLDVRGSSSSVATLYATGSVPLGRARARRLDGQKPLLLHFGALIQRAKTSFDRQTEIRPFVGLEYLMGSETSVAGDYVPRRGDNVSLASLAFRYQPARGLGAQIGTGRFRGSDTKFFVGLSLRFGKDQEGR